MMVEADMDSQGLISPGKGAEPLIGHGVAESAKLGSGGDERDDRPSLQPGHGRVFDGDGQKALAKMQEPKAQPRM